MVTQLKLEALGKVQDTRHERSLLHYLIRMKTQNRKIYTQANLAVALGSSAGRLAEYKEVVCLRCDISCFM